MLRERLEAFGSLFPVRVVKSLRWLSFLIGEIGFKLRGGGGGVPKWRDISGNVTGQIAVVTGVTGGIGTEVKLNLLRKLFCSVDGVFRGRGRTDRIFPVRIAQ